MYLKKCLALLVSAALAVSLLLTGCGGKNQSLAQVILSLLDGRYTNVTVELDPDLEAALRQAVRGAETEAEIRAALENILGPGISFQLLGDGQKGDTAWNLILYPGSDPDAAGRSGFVEWNKVFSALPGDGQYTAQVAMIETDNGYALLVQATVDRAGSQDKPDPVTLKSIAVTKDPDHDEYWVGDTFDPAGMEITAYYSNGTTKTITGITASDKKDVEWTPETFDTAGEQTVTISYGGKTTTVSVTVKESKVDKIEVTYQPATTSYTVGQSFDPTGMVVTVTYTGNIPDKIITNITSTNKQGVTWSPADGLSAETNFVTITYTEKKGSASTTVNVTVTSNTVTGEGFTYDKTTQKATITESTGLQELFSEIGDDAAKADITLSVPVTLDENWHGENITFNGTLTGNNNTITLKDTRTQGLFNEIGTSGKVQNVDIELDGTISQVGGTVGAVAGTNNGEITGCDVTISNSGKINGGTNVGGVVGYNNGSVTGCNASGSVSGDSSVGGVVGENRGRVTACYHATGSVSGTSFVGGVVGDNWGRVTACYHATGSVEGSWYVGGVVGFNWSTVTACYWSDYDGNGIGSGSGEATRVDGTDVTWVKAVDAMNAAISNDVGWWYVPNGDNAPTEFTKARPATSTTP